MGVISVRVPDDLHRELERADVRISDFVREDLIQLALRLRAQRKMGVLAKHRRPASQPVADLVRAVREEH